ncbi:MAG: hypothetical protein ACO1PM_05080, partial [Acidovorax sp.]
MKTTLPASSANSHASGAPDSGKPGPLTAAQRFQSLDLLATLVAVVAADGSVLFANSALEDALGISRRAIEGKSFPACFTDPVVLQNALVGASGNEFAALRYDAFLVRMAGNGDPLQVHVVVAQTDMPGEFVVELLPL